MIIAFSTDEKNGLDSTISHHFGRCRYYIFVELENGEVRSISEAENPYANSHGPGMVPQFIASKNAKIIVSGGMGPRAVSFFQEYGVSPVVGKNGTVKDVLNDIINNNFEIVTPNTYDINKHDRFKEN